MGRTRRTSKALEKAAIRLNNLKSISTTLDLGQGLSITAFEQVIGQTQSALDEYNRLIATLDEKTNQLLALEKQVSEMSARTLAAVGALHGKNSDQYEKAGGVRTDEIKRTPRSAVKAGTKQ